MVTDGDDLSVRASLLLSGKRLEHVRIDDAVSVALKFEDGTFLHIDLTAALELSIVGGEDSAE